MTTERDNSPEQPDGEDGGATTTSFTATGECDCGGKVKFLCPDTESWNRLPKPLRHLQQADCDRHLAAEIVGQAGTTTYVITPRGETTT